jgi:hypothetical protein
MPSASPFFRTLISNALLLILGAVVLVILVRTSHH